MFLQAIVCCPSRPLAEVRSAAISMAGAWPIKHHIGHGTLSAKSRAPCSAVKARAGAAAGPMARVAGLREVVEGYQVCGEACCVMHALRQECYAGLDGGITTVQRLPHQVQAAQMPHHPRSALVAAAAQPPKLPQTPPYTPHLAPMHLPSHPTPTRACCWTNLACCTTGATPTHTRLRRCVGPPLQASRS